MMREYFADVHADLARLPETPPGAKQLGIWPDEGEAPSARERFGHHLTVKLLQRWLGVEEFQMAGPAGHEQKDDRFRLGREVAWPSLQRIISAGPLIQERRQRHAA